MLEKPVAPVKRVMRITQNVFALAALVCTESVTETLEAEVNKTQLKRDGFVEVEYDVFLAWSRALLYGFKQHNLLTEKLIAIRPNEMATTQAGDRYIESVIR